MTSEKPASRRLGRGLEALLALPLPSSAGGPSTARRESGLDGGSVRAIAIASIRPNPFQPRRDFAPAELAELEASMATSGLLQPITVRPAPNEPGFELIAGERRLRAATRLGWTDIPAIVRQMDDRTALTLALVENLQRTDLNPVEEAEGYQRLVTEFELTQQQVADVVGKDRSTVANILRILGLPASVRRMLQEGQLTLGHARALLAAGNERAILELAREIVARGLTVRDVEHRARDGRPGRKKKVRDAQAADTRSPEVRRQEERLRRHLQTDVSIIVSAENRGEVRIRFYSPEDFERVLDLVLGAATDPV